MPVEECHYEWSDYYESDVQVCNWVETAEESAANWAAIYEAEARYQAAAEAAWGPGGVPPCAGPGSHGENQTCCPGLNTDSQSGRYEYDENGYQYYVDGYTNCNCPSYGCIGENQSVPSPQDGCGAPACCEGLTNQGGVCKPPAGTIAGTFTTTYMAAPGGSVKSNECNQNNSCNDGWQDVGEWKRTCAESSGDAFGRGRYSRRGAVCANPNPSSLCPTNIGRVASGKWTAPSGGPTGNTTDPRLQCTYSSITNPFEPITVAAFTGLGANDLPTMQKDWCNAKNYAGLTASGDCRTLYTTRTQNYDFQLVSRIQIENPNGEWATNPDYLLIVTQIAAGKNIAAGSSVEGLALARLMINNYCMLQNPRWADDNVNIRTTIKVWALQDSLDIDNATRLLAESVIDGYCLTNPNSTNCDCYNARQIRTNIFDACRGKTTTACEDINKIAEEFDAAAPIFAPQIRALKNYITVRCAVGACVNSLVPTTAYLPPSTLKELKCESNIQVCLQNVKIGGDLRAAINQSCATTINIGGPVPADPTPSTNMGLENSQVVTANANAPGGGTLAVVSSPGASGTQVTTTGTPGGGINQAVTSNTPVGIGSSGGPVSYNSPAPATTPKPMSIPLDDTQKKYALATGGFLGLSCSFLFFIFCCIIGFLIFGGGNKPAAPRVVPLTAYGL